MIKRTSPRGSASMSRKRDLPSAESAAHHTTPLFLSESAYDTAWDYDRKICSNITSKSLHYPSPNNKIDGRVATGAATVSPFSHRVMPGETSDIPLITSPPLSPVPEEPDSSNFQFSQSSNTSTLTFDCNNAASDSNCSMEMSGEESLGAITSGGNARTGTMIGNVIHSVVGCSVGGRSSFITSGSLQLNDIEVGMQSPEKDECLYPPMKRSRLDYGPHVLSQSSNDYAMSSSSPAPMIVKACKTARKISGTKKSKMNTDKYDFCCHVCFLGAADGKSSSFATTVSSDGSSVPERHSLLAYFQPTKRKMTPSSQHHQPTNSLHSFQSSLPTSLNLHPCRYCDKPTCITCTRQCEQCLNRFCTFCTKVDYDISIVERILCFECDEHHGKDTHGYRFVRRRDDKESSCMMDI